ncbi:death-associated protein-like 1 [Pristis pectinata]|uniref:death-associated protein-like 1 n=1 Tax=Pristis pectinata TaxID=685728 RepID=UPI00223CBAC5|nr:death-associated protein-like 1 [Pristis pectinata]
MNRLQSEVNAEPPALSPLNRGGIKVFLRLELRKTVAKKEEKTDQEIKSLQSSSAINASKMSFTLARTIDKLSHNFPFTIAHQKPLPALEKFSPARCIHLIHQPRKC